MRTFYESWNLNDYLFPQSRGRKLNKLAIENYSIISQGYISQGKF